MKFYCTVDGVHFKQEFEKTLEPPCNLWGEMGMSNVPVALRKKLWEWYFTMPSDEIALSCKISVGLVFKIGAIEPGDEFKNKVKGYEDWTEARQQEFQKEYFKRKGRGEDVEAWVQTLNFAPEEEEALKN